MFHRILLFVAGSIPVLLMVGCGGGGPLVEPLAPAGGTLLVDGKPLDGVVVTFVPEPSQSKKGRRGGAGTTDASGAFTVMDFVQNKPGLPSGKYTLAYSRRRLPDGSAAPPPKAGTQPDPAQIQVETLPQHLTTPNPYQPSSQVSIPKEGNTKLELKISLTN